MKAWEIVGYTYDGAYHCVDCTDKKIGERCQGESAEDAGIYPIFAIDELEGNEICDDCGNLIYFCS